MNERWYQKGVWLFEGRGQRGGTRVVLRMPRCAPPAVRWNGARYPELSVHLLLWTYEASVAEEEDSVDFEGIYTHGFHKGRGRGYDM
jgi:hypothetical protein